MCIKNRELKSMEKHGWKSMEKQGIYLRFFISVSVSYPLVTSTYKPSDSPRGLLSVLEFQ